MRVASLFVASICALLAIVDVSATQKASVHIRVAAVGNQEQGTAAASAVVPADNDADDTATTTKKSKSHHSPHLRELKQCRSIKNESFKDKIVNTCAVRDAGFDFYYQLNNGSIMRNCLCESYNNGIRDVNLGKLVVDGFNLQCYSKDAGKSKADLKKIFDHKRMLCVPWDFEEL